MKTVTTLGTFGLGLTVVLAASVGVGQAVGPVGGTSAAAAVSSVHCADTSATVGER